MALKYAADTTFSGKNLTSGSATAPSTSLGTLTISGNSRVKVSFNLTSLNGAAATFTCHLIRKTTGGTEIKRFVFSDPKVTATDTLYGSEYLDIYANDTDTFDVRIFSSNASDTSVSGTIEWIDAFRTNVDQIYSISASSVTTVNAVIGGAVALQIDGSGYAKLSAGTGTGQLDFTSGVVKSNLAQILGTALTETAGLIAAGFKQFFNIASPTSTMNTITTVTTATTATSLTNLPAITAGWLTATGIAAGALNGKGDWLLASNYVAPTNLTAAQIATAIFQDTTAGDFTVPGSIGKSLFTSGAVPGAAGGLQIAGSNAATTYATFAVMGTTTLSGAVSLGSTLGITGAVTLSSTLATGAVTHSSLTVTNAFAVNGGTTFTSSAGNGFTVSSTGGNGIGFSVTGNGSGDGMRSTPGAMGIALNLNAAGSTQNALAIHSANGDAVSINGNILAMRIGASLLASLDVQNYIHVTNAISASALTLTTPLAVNVTEITGSSSAATNLATALSTYADATGTITVDSIPADGETITISDGSSSQVGEFATTPPGGSNVWISTASGDPMDVAANIANVFLGLAIDMTSSGNAVALRNRADYGAQGNVDITTTSGALTITGMSGGANGGVITNTTTNGAGSVDFYADTAGITTLLTRVDSVAIDAANASAYSQTAMGQTTDAAIENAVWNADQASHVDLGTTGASLNTAASGGGGGGTPGYSGVAQAGSASNITLASSASSSNSEYVGQSIVIRAGTATQEVRTITAYDGATKIATVASAWVSSPTTGTAYVLPGANAVGGPVTLAPTQSFNNTGQTTPYPSANSNLIAGDTDLADAPAFSGVALEAALNYLFSRNFEIENLDSSNWAQVVFTVKRAAGDADTAALLTIIKTSPTATSDGLTLQNGAAPVSPVTKTDGSITVTAATTMGMMFTVDLTAYGMGLTAAGTFVWEVTIYTTAGKGPWLGSGNFSVEQSVRQTQLAV